MSLQGFILEGPFSYNADVAIGANLLVQVGTVEGGVILCPAGGAPTGVCPDAHAQNILATVYPTRGRALVEASAAIAAGDLVKAAAAGQVAPEAVVTTRTAFTIGVAETAAAGAASKFWMIWL